jgi:hypothetical protein
MRAGDFNRGRIGGQIKAYIDRRYSSELATGTWMIR